MVDATASEVGIEGLNLGAIADVQAPGAIGLRDAGRGFDARREGENKGGRDSGREEDR